MMDEEQLKFIVGEEVFNKLTPEARTYLCNVGETFGNEFTSEDIAKIVKTRYGL